MASSSADCVLGVVRLISSASSTLVKIGPRLNSNFCSSGGIDRNAQHVGGQHVAGELHALKSAIERARQSLAERGLADSRYSFDQQMPARKKRNHRKADHVVLAANDVAQAHFPVEPRGWKRRVRPVQTLIEFYYVDRRMMALRGVMEVIRSSSQLSSCSALQFVGSGTRN